MTNDNSFSTAPKRKRRKFGEIEKSDGKMRIKMGKRMKKLTNTNIHLNGDECTNAGGDNNSIIHFFSLLSSLLSHFFLCPIPFWLNRVFIQRNGIKVEPKESKEPKEPLPSVIIVLSLSFLLLRTFHLKLFSLLIKWK